MEYLCCGSKKKKKKGPPGHRTNFQKSIDQNQSFFYSWPYVKIKYKDNIICGAPCQNVACL